ncbi:MAG: hypothetical protein NC412_02030 [Roseburia sp.]|nr:hypothetical protein [Roseburia sp.]MCM1278019.1 hypothetical protein [Robinsoniella sp.]
MNTKNIPAIISLSAGAVTSIITYVLGYEVKAMLGILLAVLLLFYVAGLIVKSILDKFQDEIKQKEEEEERLRKEEEEREGAVIEKEAAKEQKEPSDTPLSETE